MLLMVQSEHDTLTNQPSMWNPGSLSLRILLFLIGSRTLWYFIFPVFFNDERINKHRVFCTLTLGSGNTQQPFDYCLCLFFLVPPTVSFDDRYKDTQAVKAGSTLILPINFTGIPKPKVTWYHGNTRLHEQRGHVHLDTGDSYSTLTMTGIEKEEAGKYRVHIENEAGSAECEFDVMVKCKCH